MNKVKKKPTAEQKKAYFEHFFSLEAGSYRQAYIATEKWWGQRNKPMYTSYDSFRKGKGQYLKTLTKRKRYPNN